MSTADVLSWFLLVVATYAALVCAWLATAALWPTAVARCAALYARPVRTTLVGLAAGGPLLVLAAAAAGKGRELPGASVLGAALLLLLPLPAVFGLAGLARRVGEALAAGAEDKPWRAALRGGLVLAATFLLPFAGWFVLLPWGLLSGFGAAILTWRSRS
jgi:hypothetical protein